MTGTSPCEGCGKKPGRHSLNGVLLCWDCWNELDEIAEQTGTPGGSWAAVDLTDVVVGVQAGRVVGPVPTLVSRTDGVPLFYRGEVHSISGEPESCKGWIILNGAKSVLEVDGHVLYLDFEDGAPSIVIRLLALGVSPEAIIQRFTYVRPVDPFSPEAFYEVLRIRSYELAAVDGLTEAYGLLGLDVLSNDDAAKFLSAIPRPIADRGAAVVLADHVGRNKETRGRYALGAQHKLAGIGVAYSTEVVKPLSRTDAGLIKLKVEKDRHGHVRGHAQAGQIALVHITPEDNGQRVTVSLEPPEDNTGDDGEFRPTNIMEKISRYLENEPGATRNAIRRAIHSKAEWVDAGLAILVREGYVERRQQGQAQRHEVARAYREIDDRVPESQPSPYRVPDPVGTNRVPESPPVGDSDPDPVESSPAENNNRVPHLLAAAVEVDVDGERERITAKFGQPDDWPEQPKEDA